MGTSPYSSAGYISRLGAPYNGLEYDFRVRGGLIVRPAMVRLPNAGPPARRRQKMPMMQ
jgi:hypothetical protein